MAKKKSAKRDHRSRIDVSDYGIDLEAIIDEIRPHLAGTHAEIAQRAGGMTAGTVSNALNGSAKPSLGTVAALARAAGGSVEVTFVPAVIAGGNPKSRKP